MNEKKPEQENFDFEKEPEPEPLTFEQQHQITKERIETGIAIDKGYEDTRKKIYSLLSRQEQEELDNLPTISEKRAYVIRKYSKLFGSIQE